MAGGENQASGARVVDLFCGAGGFSLGFALEDATLQAAVDHNPIHLEVHKENFPSAKHFEQDLQERPIESPEDLGLGTEPDIVVGGPPCQGFSVMGKRDPEDERNRLVLSFAEAVGSLSPAYFVMENVPGFLAEKDHNMFSEFMATIDAMGYRVLKPVQTLNARDYGVPQDRSRVFLIGYREGETKPSYPEPGYPIFGFDQAPTCWDALQDLPSRNNGAAVASDEISVGELGEQSPYVKTVNADSRSNGSARRLETLGGMAISDHNDETIRRFSETEPGEYEEVSRFYRLEEGGVSPTLRAGTGPSRGSYMAARPIHPRENRCVTVRESARLHSFPDWFAFHHTKWHSLRQIGNSVPPLLARAIAREVLTAWGE